MEEAYKVEIAWMGNIWVYVGVLYVGVYCIMGQDWRHILQ